MDTVPAQMGTAYGVRLVSTVQGFTDSDRYILVKPGCANRDLTICRYEK